MLASGFASAAGKLTVSGDSRCPTRAQIEKTLKPRLAAAPAGSQVRAILSQSSVELRFLPGRGAAELSRTFQGGADECEAIADAAGVLLEGWIRERLQTVKPPQKKKTTEKPPKDDGKTPPDETGSGTPDVPPEGVKNEVPEVSETPPPPEVLPVPAEVGEAPPLLARIEPPPAPKVPPEVKREPPPLPPLPEAKVRRFAVSAIAQAGMLLGRPDLKLGVAGRVQTGLSRRWGVALDVSGDEAHDNLFGPGQVSASIISVGLLARASLHPESPHGVELLLGPELERIAATATGYTETRSATLYDPGLTFMLQWHHELGENLFANFFVALDARYRSERFAIEPLGTAMVLPPFHLRSGVGIGWGL